MQDQQPYRAPVPPPPTPSPTAPARSRGPLAIALLIGLLVGAAGVGAAWAVTGDRPRTGSSAADAHGACSALDVMDESLLTARDGVSDDQRMQALHRFQGAVSLAQAAAATDASYKPLEQSLIQAYNGYVTRFDSGPESKKALEKARHICADL